MMKKKLFDSSRECYTDSVIELTEEIMKIAEENRGNSENAIITCQGLIFNQIYESLPDEHFAKVLSYALIRGVMHHATLQILDEKVEDMDIDKFVDYVATENLLKDIVTCTQEQAEKALEKTISSLITIGDKLVIKVAAKHLSAPLAEALRSKAIGN